MVTNHKQLRFNPNILTLSSWDNPSGVTWGMRYMYVFTYGLEDVKTEFDYAQFRYFMQNYQYSSPKPSADFRMARSDVTPLVENQSYMVGGLCWNNVENLPTKIGPVNFENSTGHLKICSFFIIN